MRCGGRTLLLLVQGVRRSRTGVTICNGEYFENEDTTAIPLVNRIYNLHNAVLAQA